MTTTLVNEQNNPKLREILSNMRVWGRVCKTDPKDTKKVSFGRSFTSIAPISQAKKATEVFGPFGEGWGVTDVTYERIHIEHTGEILVACSLDLWHGSKDNRVEGLVSAEALLGKTSKGLKLDSEAWKKARTNAISKGLSFLGFNADVFEGLFDQPNYIRWRQEELQREESDRRQRQQAEQQKRQSVPKQQEAPKAPAVAKAENVQQAAPQGSGERKESAPKPSPAATSPSTGQTSTEPPAPTTTDSPSGTPQQSRAGSGEAELAMFEFKIPGGTLLVPSAPAKVDEVKWINGLHWAFWECPWEELGAARQAERYQELLVRARQVHAEVAAGSLPATSANGWIMGWGQRNRGLAGGAS